jgi:hypothetical protein
MRIFALSAFFLLFMGSALAQKSKNDRPLVGTIGRGGMEQTNTGFATEYFVDSESGNDAAVGTSADTAWQSLDAVNGADLHPGDTVHFKRGGQWRGQLKPKSGKEGAPVTYTAYGPGNEKPRLLGSVPLDKPTDWIHEGNHLWSTCPDVVRQGNEDPNFLRLVWSVHQEGGADISVKTAPQIRYAHDLPVKEYTLSCNSPGTRQNHIQLIAHGFKVEKGKNYLLRFMAHSSQPFVIPSISLCEPRAPWGGLGPAIRRPEEIGNDWKEYEVLIRCDTSHDNARFTLSLGGALPVGSEFSFVPLPLCEATVETTGIDTDVGNIILDGNKAGFKKWTHGDLKEQDDFWYDEKTSRIYYYSGENPATKYKNIEAALHQHIVDHTNVQHVIFDDLDIRYGAAHGFGGTNAKHCIYRNLDISWIGGADQYRQGGNGRRVRFGNGIEFWSNAEDCLVENCRLWEIYDAALTNQGSGVNVERNIVYRNNTIWNCEYSFEYWNRGPESLTENVVFENNICVDAGFGWGHIQRPDKNGRHVMIYNNEAKTKNVMIRNNIFSRATESLVRIDSDFRDGLSMEGNRYWQENGGTVFWWLIKNRYNADDFQRYQVEVGFDKTSTFQKPTDSSTRRSR